MSATFVCAVYVNVAADVADSGVVVSGVCHSTSDISIAGIVYAAVDAEVLNECTCRDDAEDTEVIMCSG